MEEQTVGGVPRTNWSGNYRYRREAVMEPATVAEIQAAIRGVRRARALGTRHSFNGIADTTGLQISTRRLCEVEIDAASQTVRVGAGVRYGELAVALDRAGWALHNLASLPHISVAGAVATATHGSGLGNGNLATAVREIELVGGDGDVHGLSRERDGERFAGTVVGLGALGVVTHLRLAIQPRFMMRQTVYENLPFDALDHGLEQVMGAAYSVSLFTDWQGGRVRQAWVKQRLADGGVQPVSPDFFGARIAERPLHPLPDQGADACTEQGPGLGPWFERLSHFRLEFQPSHGQEIQSEYFVPFEAGYAAIRAVERLRERITPLLYVSELRAVAADDLWMSMHFERRSLGLHFTWRPHQGAVLAALPAIEEALRPFDARPHWGKVFTMPGEVRRRLYPRFEDFLALQRDFDPEGRFRTDLLDGAL